MVLSVLYTFRIFAWPFELAGQFGTRLLKGLSGFLPKAHELNIPSQFSVFILTEKHCALWGGFNTQAFL